MHSSPHSQAVQWTHTHNHHSAILHIHAPVYAALVIVRAVAAYT
jgi:hypothetical protein